ncbi:thioredoxin-like protein [Dactylonectria macrodidyma]|uniref:Thioredoxin-like protein n=1 Tax=Dactylonectria macrodidyma TaxID=307937 RepID=A0A9P9JBP8_9HYPO|nr:thioredoxin-like protein [Dactylonectria macrodidyma]
METIYYIILAIIAVFIVGPAIFSDRSPIPETSGEVFKVTKAPELDAVLSSTTHVIVDFYADWCPPCRAIAPLFSQLADAHSAKGQLAFVKVNVDHVNDVAKRYSVSAMPTFVVFENGQPKGIPVEGLKDRRTVNFTADGSVDRLRGADPVALKAVVAALAAKVKGAA